MLKQNKRGISELVSYILLITLTIAIAAGTYAWLRSIATPPQNVECPDVSLWVVNDTCFGQNFEADGKPTDVDGNLTFYLENKGRIDINGFRIQVSGKTINPIFEDITLEKPNHGGWLTISNVYPYRINASEKVEINGVHNVRTINLIRVTPMKKIDNKDAYCKSIDFQIDDCIPGTGGPGS
jgi:hypothetical protein